MIFLALILLTLANCGAYASEIPDTVKIVFEFPDDRDENGQPKKTETTFDKVKYFETVTNVISPGFKYLSPATPLEPIPLSQGTKKDVFDCLLDLISSTTGAVDFSRTEVTQLRDTFKIKLDSNYKTLSKQSLLQTADYLNAHKQITYALAAFNTNSLRDGPFDPFFNKLAKQSKDSLASWLLHDSIEDPAIKGVQQEIGTNTVRWSSCVSTEKCVAWISERALKIHELEFFYYDLQKKHLSRIPIIYNNADRNFVALTGNNNRFSISLGERARNNFVASFFQAINLDRSQFFSSERPFNIHNYNGTIDYACMIYDTKVEDFISLFQDGHNRRIILQSNKTGQQQINLLTNSLPEDFLFDHLLLNPWQSFENHLLCVNPIQKTIIVYNLDTQTLEFDGTLNDYALERNKAFDIVNCYFRSDISNTIHDSKTTITKNKFVPEFATIMEKRVHDPAVKEIISGNKNCVFDPATMRYIMKARGFQEGRLELTPNDSLTFYDLLPYNYNAALRFFIKNYQTLPQLLFNVWYVDQAERRTVHWKNMDPGMGRFLASEIKKLYPLAPSNIGLRLLSTIKHSIGSFWQRSSNAINYTYLMYGRIFKYNAVIFGVLGGWLYLVVGSNYRKTGY